MTLGYYAKTIEGCAAIDHDVTYNTSELNQETNPDSRTIVRELSLCGYRITYIHKATPYICQMSLLA
jgi:hypothetical protein